MALPLQSAGYREPSPESPTWPFLPTVPVADAIRAADRAGWDDPSLHIFMLSYPSN